MRHRNSPIRPTCSELVRSYSYYDAFHQGETAFWHAMHAANPTLLAQFYTMFPVPRAHVARVEMAQKTKRAPFHELGARDIDDGILQALNSELGAGTHPTTQALVPLGMRFLKVLGAGTQGTAVLFEIDDDNGTTRNVVAKYDTETNEDGEGLGMEKERMKVSESGQNIQYIVAVPTSCCIPRYLIRSVTGTRIEG